MGDQVAQLLPQYRPILQDAGMAQQNIGKAHGVAGDQFQGAGRILADASALKRPEGGVDALQLPIFLFSAPVTYFG